MSKVLKFNKMIEIKHEYLGEMPDKIKASFGDLVKNFVMLVYGNSSNGKTSLILQIIKELSAHGSVLYVSLEEGFSASMQRAVKTQLADCTSSLSFADHEMSKDKLMEKLAKKRSPQFVVIDSLQYWKITYADYQKLKEAFPKKTFIFISHQKGNRPDGKTAEKIQYDAGVKVRVEGHVAFVGSRYGGNKPYLIWAEGAEKYWGKKKLKKILE